MEKNVLDETQHHLLPPAGRLEQSGAVYRALTLL